MEKREARWDIPGRKKRGKEENELSGLRRGVEDGQLPHTREQPGTVEGVSGACRELPGEGLL